MMEGRDFLRAYTYLEGMGDEVGPRSQTGRAYFAAYLESRSFCEVHFDYKRSGMSREHGDISRLLKRIDSKLADDLAFLRRLRNLADYDLSISSETARLQAADAGKVAQSIIQHLDQVTFANPDQDDR